MKDLSTEVENREPIRVYIKEQQDKDWTDLGIYKYNESKKRYEGNIGHITIENITKIILGYKNLNHIKIEFNG